MVNKNLKLRYENPKPKVPETMFWGEIVSHQMLGNIHRYKNGFRFIYKINFESGDEKTVYVQCIKTKSEAVALRERCISELYTKTYIPYDYLVLDFLNYYLYYYLIGEKEITYNTFMLYRSLIENHTKILHQRKMSELTIEILTEAGLSIKTKPLRKSYRGFIMGASKFAYEHHMMKLNLGPAVSKNILKYEKDSFTLDPDKVYKKERPVYDRNQIRTLLLECKKKNDVLYLTILLQCTLGTRISETLALTYTDINLTAKTININKQIGRKIDSDGTVDKKYSSVLKPKSRHGVRTVVVPDFVFDEIIAARKRYEEHRTFFEKCFEETNYIICDEFGQPYNRNTMTSCFHELLEEIGLPPIHLHDLRHCYATFLNEAEIIHDNGEKEKLSLKAVSTYMGHASKEFTDVHYIKHEAAMVDILIPTVLRRWNDLYKVPDETEEIINVNFPEEYLKVLDIKY